MNRRIAIKIMAHAHPDRYSRQQVKTALRRVRRYLDRAPRVYCEDCPIGGREGGPVCPRARACDREATAFTLTMSLETGHYPWGSWRCMMQRASGVGP